MSTNNFNAVDIERLNEEMDRAVLPARRFVSTRGSVTLEWRPRARTYKVVARGPGDALPNTLYSGEALKDAVDKYNDEGARLGAPVDD